MKSIKMKIIKNIILSVSLLAFIACSKDDNGGAIVEPELGIVTLVGPVDQETVISIQPVLSWEAYASDAEIFYEILLGTSQTDLLSVTDNLSSLEYTYGIDTNTQLDTNTTYYWKVIAYEGERAVAESEVQSFTTETIHAVRLTENATFSKRIRGSAAAFNDKLWIIGGTDETGNDLTDIWSSEDGITWTNEGDFPFGTLYEHKLITFNNKLWLYGGVIAGIVSSKIYSSEDGVNWIEETETTPFLQYNNVRMVVWNNQIFRIAGFNASIDELSEERATYSSSDGLNWNLLTTNHGFDSKYNFWVAGIGDQLIAIEPSSDQVSITLYTSEDGISWDNQRVWETAERGYLSVKPVRVGDRLILVTPSPSNTIGISTFYETNNGIDWTLATAIPETALNPINYDLVDLNGKLYAIGGTRLTSQTTSADNQVWILN